jgi:hypothetical protein
MMRAGDFLSQQITSLLASKRQTLVFAILLALLPFGAWLSVALVALVTLRKGAKLGFELLVPAAVMHMLPFVMFVPASSALVNTLITYIPCYLAAVMLRRTASWQVVSGLFLGLSLATAVLVQCFMPQFIVAQFAAFKSLIAEYPGYQQWMESGSDVLQASNWSELFFGFQIVSLSFSAILSLLCARGMQAKLFNPGGFKQEMLAFRSAKPALLVLIASLIAAYYGLTLAWNILPLVLCYFVISGFALAYCLLAGKRQGSVFALLVILLLLKPSLVLLAYVIFGSLDSVFNFRVYLPQRVSKST